MLKKIIIAIAFISTSVFAESNLENKSAPSVHFVKQLLTESLKHIGYCKEYSALKTNHPQGKFNGYAPFINQIERKNVTKYYGCTQIKMILEADEFKQWKKDNKGLYALAYTAGVCDLAKDINEIENDDPSVDGFLSDTNKHFKRRIYDLHDNIIDTDNSLIQKHEMVRRADYRDQCQKYTQSYYSENLNLGEIIHELIVSKRILK